MQNTQPADDASLLNSVSRIENSLAEINARIARLAMSLDAPLATEADVAQILHRETAVFLQHDREHLIATLTQEEHRVLHQWEELRGLLVLRRDLMAHSLKDLGLEATLQITLHTEAQLERDGFKPGAEGFDMLERLTP
ncbi:MAG: hypothetical protein M3R45_13810 [Pseudomonadota bacterium]|nr:hypothetical protein [Pseudomonadota bacterium]